MKTDYISQGAAAMARLRQTAAAARQIQREQLQTILQQNAAAAYGLRHGFPASAPWRIFRAGSRSPATGTMSPTSRRSSPAAPGS